MLNDEDIIKIILDEKLKVDNLKNKEQIYSWFWDVGFKYIDIDNYTYINLIVDRPNKFIGKPNKKHVNFLVHINKVFSKLGYDFRLTKNTDIAYLDIIKSYCDNLNEVQ